MNKFRGGVMILFSCMALVMVGFLGMAVDVGRVLVVMNQLQNAADSVALSSAAKLYPTLATGGPNWAAAQSQATSVIGNNRVEGTALTDVTTQVGFWSMNNTPSGSLQATTITPTSTDSAAIQATIYKKANTNGGPISLFFGQFIGKPTLSLSATAIAIAGAPYTVPAGALFPLGLAKPLYDAYWDYTLEQPKIDPSTGKPYEFTITQGPNGGWTSFTTGGQDSPTIIGFITGGNNVPLSIGENIWMANGVKTDVYYNVIVNKDYAGVVVATPTPGTWEPIYAFTALHIDSSVGGSGKYLTVHFSDNYKIPATVEGGPYYGVYSPPILVK